MISKMQSQKLELISTSDGTRQLVEMNLWDTSPDDNHAVLIEVFLNGNVIRGTSQYGYFRAFCDVRKQLESLNLMPICFAACENVYPSSMIESMGYAEQAYLLTMGKQAKMSDLVDIFDTRDDIRPVTVEKQRQLFDNWFNSICLKP